MSKLKDNYKFDEKEQRAMVMIARGMWVGKIANILDMKLREVLRVGKRAGFVSLEINKSGKNFKKNLAKAKKLRIENLSGRRICLKDSDY